MIAPVGPSTIARAAPAARVRRADSARSAEAAEDTGPVDEFALPGRQAPGPRAGRSRAGANFLGALLGLQRGG